MNLLEAQTRINSLMSAFVTQVKGATAMGHTDLNRAAETVLIPLFAEVYGYRDLKNLNFTEGANYPAIDLGDEKARVAFQITATPDGEKVRDTLRKFGEYELYRKYDRLIIYVLTEKQKTYSSNTFREIVQGKFAFDADRDILDYRDLLKEISSLQINRVRKVQNILEANFGEGAAPLFIEFDEQQTESVTLNLLELFFPSTLYVADLLAEPNSFAKSRKRGKSKHWRSSPRDLAQERLKQLDLKFSTDWECHENKVITFHDLTDDSLPLAKIIDKGTVTTLSPEEFYGIDENYERVFKTLLGRCLQQKLYYQRVLWQEEDKLFIFAEDGVRADSASLTL
jgi:hypothetical protein